jgi:hypothetical protein
MSDCDYMTVSPSELQLKTSISYSRVHKILTADAQGVFKDSVLSWLSSGQLILTAFKDDNTGLQAYSLERVGPINNAIVRINNVQKKDLPKEVLAQDAYAFRKSKQGDGSLVMLEDGAIYFQIGKSPHYWTDAPQRHNDVTPLMQYRVVSTTPIFKDFMALRGHVTELELANQEKLLDQIVLQY